jgi:hypothetical protein
MKGVHYIIINNPMQGSYSFHMIPNPKQITSHVMTQVPYYPMQDNRDFLQVKEVIIRFEAL